MCKAGCETVVDGCSHIIFQLLLQVVCVCVFFLSTEATSFTFILVFVSQSETDSPLPVSHLLIC